VSEQSYDLVIIGSGPAGYVGAIRAAQLGLSVACVEKENLGGVCLNWGCIPTKALLAAAEFYKKMLHEAQDWGLLSEKVSHDWGKVIARSRKVAGNLNKGVASLFKKHKITHVPGHGKITAPGKIDVSDENGNVTQQLSAKHILIATGAKPKTLPGVSFDHEKIINSRDAMILDNQPKRLAVVGAGAIGIEYAYFYNAFGTEVTVIEMLDRLLPVEDDDVSKELARAFRKYGIKTHTSTKTQSIEKTDAGVKLTISPVDDDAKTEEIEADRVLLAIGVAGNYAGLFDESLGLETYGREAGPYRDHIKADIEGGTYKTSVEGVYAVGDVCGPPWLAHKASEEAIVCVERIAGHHAEPLKFDEIPGCTYCQPQVASFGKTERALKEEGLKAGEDYHVGKFPFTASGKAQAAGHTAGFVKIIKSSKDGEILGTHMIGENVTELLAEMSLAKRAELTPEEVIQTIHSHPTLSEAIHEAALGTDGRMIHF
jgi:dihydrolipoamide dehydrogenase